MTKLTVPENELNVTDINDSFAGTAPRNKERFALYCATVLNYQIPHPAACKEHQSPLDALWGAYTDKSDFMIWHAMRGSGKTQLLAMLAYLESLFKPHCGTTILGGSLEQSTKAIKYLSELWERPKAPRHLLKSGAVAGRGYELTNGSWVMALAASQKSVRGPHPQKLRLDEVDEMAPEIFDAALGQPKEAHGIKDQVVASSTEHHPFGMMANIIDNRHERGASLYRWCVEEVREPRGFWTSDEISRRQRQITQAMWDAEYLLKRPSISDTVFDYDLVEQAWERGLKQKYEKGMPTVAGIDWGHGTTVLQIIQDRKERYTVPETYRWHHIELTERCSKIAELAKTKKVERVFADSNPKDSNITLNKVLPKYGAYTRIQPILFSKYKTIGIEVLRYMFERNLIDITDKETKENLQKYHYKDPEKEQVEKVDDHDVDALISWAASKYNLLGTVPTRVKVKQKLPSAWD
jgi:hypothetical protein